MLRKFGSHLRNQWMGASALFLVLGGGTAYAVTQIDRNSVKSKHIVDGQIRSADVADDASGFALGGQVINEATLKKVPDADELDGKDSGAFASAAADTWTEIGQPNAPSFAAVAPIQVGCRTYDPITGYHQGFSSRPTSWTNSNANSWNTAAFYRDPWGTVHLKGLVKRDEGGTCEPPAETTGVTGETEPVQSDDDIFTLPNGYRPAREEIFAIASMKAYGELRIAPGGAVQASNPSKYGSISLDGITFRCAPSGQNGCP